MLEVLGLKLIRCKFLLFAFSFVHTNMNLYIQCMYLVYTSYQQALNKYVHKHVCHVCIYIHVCTMYVQCIYLSEPGSFQFILSHTMNLQFLSLSEAFHWWMPFVRAWTPFVIGIDNAMVQEFAFLYMQCIYPLRTALAGGQLSCSIFWKTCTYAYVSVWTWFNSVWTVYIDVCTCKYENATGKLTKCQCRF